MKKTVTLFILFCVSTAVFAQQQYFPSPYPVPTLVEENVPAFVVQRQEPNKLTPDIMYPYAFIPMVNKQACTVECINSMSRCLRTGGSESSCRASVYLPCLENCPGGYFYDQPPVVAYPAPLSVQRQECLSTCDLAYRHCLGAGGTVTKCSRGVLNPCEQNCNVEYPVPAVQRPAPVGLSCTEQCRWDLEPCFATGSAGCNVVLNSCLKACPDYRPPVEPEVQKPMQYPAPAPSYEITIGFVPQPREPTFWEKVKIFFFG